jgi:hypothetical protein
VNASEDSALLDDDDDDPDDPEYQIAYDVNLCKVGCVLIQAALGGTLPSDLYYEHFDVNAWTVNVAGCQVFPIRKSQLPLLVAKTDFNR